MPGLSAAEMIRLLDLEPHPEGGFYRQTFCDVLRGDRAASTAIYFLLARGQVSVWHRIDAVEIWHYYGGAPLELWVAMDGATPATRSVLGPDLTAGARPQLAVPAHAWQSAQSTGDWTLVGCTVAPGFEWTKFEAAPAGWTPG
jgi:predicted cupin superfamily sugar epimerase